MNDLQSTFLIFSASRRWLSLVRKVWEKQNILSLNFGDKQQIAFARNTVKPV